VAYTLNSGIESNGLDNTQRSLLMGLPIIALVLSFGAIHKHNPGGSPPVSTHTIPVVSSLSMTTPSSGSGGTSSSSPPGTAGSGSAPSSNQSPAVVAGGSGSSLTGSSLGSTGGTVGGRGGGPTGGSGGTSLPDCSVEQIATVTCQVPACSPEVTLAPGQKAVLYLDGTCAVLN